MTGLLEGGRRPEGLLEGGRRPKGLLKGGRQGSKLPFLELCGVPGLLEPRDGENPASWVLTCSRGGPSPALKEDGTLKGPLKEDGGLKPSLKVDGGLKPSLKEDGA